MNHDIDYWFVLKDLMVAMRLRAMTDAAYYVINTPGYAPAFKEYCREWLN